MRKIVELDQSRLGEALDFSWQIYNEPENSCFPVFTDKNDLQEALERTFSRPDRKLLALEQNSELIGVLPLSINEGNNIQANGIFMREPCDDFIAYIKKHYAGYELDIGYPPENIAALETMKRLGAELLESSTRTNLDLNDIKPQKTHGVTVIDESSFGAFAAFHDAHQVDMYWTSELIEKKLEQWLILAVFEDGKIVGSLLAGIWAEQLADIYALFIDRAHLGAGIEERLLNALISRSKEMGKTQIMYFVDDDCENEKEAAQKTGFTKISSYRGFRINF